MKRHLLLIAALAGCAHKPEVEVREVPVPVTCVDPAKIPPEPPLVAQRFNGNARHDLVILAESARDLREWGQQMHALLEICAEKAPEE